MDARNFLDTYTLSPVLAGLQHGQRATASRKGNSLVEVGAAEAFPPSKEHCRAGQDMGAQSALRGISQLGCFKGAVRLEHYSLWMHTGTVLNKCKASQKPKLTVRQNMSNLH